MLLVLYVGDIWIDSFDLSDEERDRNENIFIFIAFFIVKMRRIFSYAVKIYPYTTTIETITYLVDLGFIEQNPVIERLLTFAKHTSLIHSS